MLVSVLFNIPIIMFGGYSPNYTCYLMLRLICCTILPCIWIAGSSLKLELFGPGYRQSVALVGDFLWPISNLILILVVYLVRSWINQHLVIGAFGFLCLPCFLIFPESPRWLTNNGRKEEAEGILLKIAKGNKQEVSLQEREQIRNILSRVEQDSHRVEEKNLSILNMFKTKSILKTTLILIMHWVTANVSQFTLALNVTKLHGDVFINFIMGILLGDMPGTFALIITMKYFGRRFNLFYIQSMIGVCCLFLAFLPKTVSFISTPFADILQV